MYNKTYTKYYRCRFVVVSRHVENVFTLATNFRNLSRHTFTNFAVFYRDLLTKIAFIVILWQKSLFLNNALTKFKFYITILGGFLRQFDKNCTFSRLFDEMNRIILDALIGFAFNKKSVSFLHMKIIFHFEFLNVLSI